MSTLGQPSKLLMSLIAPAAWCWARDRQTQRAQGLPRQFRALPWHSQVWKGVRSGRERVFLRIGNDFSISSFKIIFPKLEVTWEGRKEDGPKTLIPIYHLQMSRAGVLQAGPGAGSWGLGCGLELWNLFLWADARPHWVGSPEEQGVRAAQGHSAPVTSPSQTMVAGAQYRVIASGLSMTPDTLSPPPEMSSLHHFPRTQPTEAWHCGTTLFCAFDPNINLCALESSMKSWCPFTSSNLKSWERRGIPLLCCQRCSSGMDSIVVEAESLSPGSPREAGGVAR